MVLLPRCVFKRLLLFNSGNQQTTKRLLLSELPAALLHRHVASGLRSKSSFPELKERTLVAVKPDGVQRHLVGQIIQRFEQRGFKLVGLKMLQVSEDLLSQHYAELKNKPFYPGLMRYMTAGPVVVMVWEGYKVVQTSRMMVGNTNPAEAMTGTVRGDFSFHVSRNVVHASDSLEGAQREIQLWFHKNELLDWKYCLNMTCDE